MTDNLSPEALLAQVAAAQARDPGAFASDALTKAILDKLNEEVARVYAEANAAGEDLGAEEEGAEGEDEEADENEAGGSPAGKSEGGASRVQLRKGPQPVELWRAVHEVDRTPKERVVLTQQAWGDLVSRLNESSRRKQLFLLKAQHKQIADQLAGLTFAPQISAKSRELAALNKTLPERVAALMRKKKARLDKIRAEKAQKDLEDATFKPKLNKPRKAAADELGASSASASERRVGHLLQYEIDRRMRAEQRRALVQEMEDKSLTFSPVINKNSSRIVERLQREAAERGARVALGESAGLAGGMGADGGGGSPGREGSGMSVSASQALSRAAAERKRVEDILLGRARAQGRSHLPGHEEETFQPTINARSKNLRRAGESEGVAVHDRLYDQRRRAEAEAEERVRSAHKREEETGLPSSLAHVAGGGGGGYPTTADGEPLPGHPHFFSAVAWAPAGQHDFLLRRLLAPPSLGLD